MIDPLKRWRQYGEKPDYAGPLSFGDLRYTEDPEDLVGVDVAIVGAPMDDLVSGRPGARFAPRAIRAAGRPSGPHLDTGVDAFAALDIVDFGDAPVLPGDVETSRRAIEETVAQVVDAGTVPIVLGGDHSVTEPNVRALAGRTHSVGLIHFDAHADTFPEVLGSALSHGTPMYRLVEAGHVDPLRYVQIGLRGYSPSHDVRAWQTARGIRSVSMQDLRIRGIRDAIEFAVRIVDDGPAFLTVDVDVLDPAFAPGTGTPEPGGMTAAELLWAVRTVAESVNLVGADVVEVIPTAVGSADVTALVADRIVREMLTGIALSRSQ